MFDLSEVFWYGLGAVSAALIVAFTAYNMGVRAGRESMPQWAEVEKFRIEAEADSRKTMWENLGRGGGFADPDAPDPADDDVRYLGR